MSKGKAIGIGLVIVAALGATAQVTREEFNNLQALVQRNTQKIMRLEKEVQRLTEKNAEATELEQSDTKGEEVAQQTKPLRRRDIETLIERYLHAPRGETDAARELRREKIKKEIVGQKVRMRGILRSVRRVRGHYMASVRYTSRQTVEVGVGGGGGFTMSSGTTRTEPALTITLQATTKDKGVLQLDQRSAVTTEGQIKAMRCNNGKPGKSPVSVTIELTDSRIY